ncbi:acyl-CoA dehydrogenase [Trinickia violacea]|uniref:Acyl-CoA dehydrogenase n=1 Tax=Trinickia violacea TaxID=2571746 RepID=A0A4P8IN22_9BURK|nr:acyl-CoA dehydrogenase family protein [Trinickia violacea]QCP50388.1 acyl-CoA dehydrogenase [Trinickia violacea]
MTVEREGLEDFRLNVRSWLTQNVPHRWRARMTGASADEFTAFQREWMGKVVSAGLATPHWSAQWPGGGRSLDEQIVIVEEMARADAPRLLLYFVALYHAAMTLMEWGTEEQKARHLPAILNGEIWCQGFSEPNAGSDLASLTTRAVRDGDHYVIDGQKIWSTLGQHADYCLLLVRTDASVPKQAGITFLLMDMKSPGVECRPIRQITGDEEFAEIFLSGVRVPVANRLGEENAGWRIAQTTLNSERGLTIFELSERLSWSRWRLIEAMGGNTGGSIVDDQLRREMVDVFTKIEALSALVKEMMKRLVAGEDTGSSASIVKLLYAQVLREYTALGVRGASTSHLRTPFTLGAGHETGNWWFDYMNSFMWTIAGGSNEIQRNIVSERMLGMPRERAA